MDEDWEKYQAEEEAERQRLAIPAPPISQDEFLAWRSPRQVDANPTRLDNPLWQWMVQTQHDAYSANKEFHGPSPFDAGPMWCFQRFGKSETVLADGRIVHIAGEHEDSYDPDFHIYNDVVIVSPGGGIEIYAYPAGDFPPTDFHSATLAGNAIYIVGCLGYPEQRVAETTPVYRLDLASMQISAVTTFGTPPGWIMRHSGILSGDGKTITISGGETWHGAGEPFRQNIDSWSLNIASGEWRRLTTHKWQHWFVRREDRQPMRIWDTRQAQWHEENKHLGMERYWRHAEAPNIEALDLLYRLDQKCTAAEQGEEYNEYSTTIDGLPIRFRECQNWLEIVVEGELAPHRLAAFKSHLLEYCSRLESSRCIDDC